MSMYGDPNVTKYEPLPFPTQFGPKRTGDGPAMPPPPPQQPAVPMPAYRPDSFDDTDDWEGPAEPTWPTEPQQEVQPTVPPQQHAKQGTPEQPQQHRGNSVAGLRALSGLLHIAVVYQQETGLPVDAAVDKLHGILEILKDNAAMSVVARLS